MRSKIPSLLAILILVSGTVILLFAKSQIQTFTSGATDNFAPQNLRITNIEDSSAVISWITQLPTVGYVEYSNADGNFKTNPSLMASTHLVIIQNLSSNSSYSFKVNSGGNLFDNSGNGWQFQTQSKNITGSSSIVSGIVLEKTNLPAKNSLVYVTANGQTWATLVSASGNWIISLPGLSPDTLLNIEVEENASSLATAKIIMKDANPVPSITLGSSYDFTNENANPAVDTPNVPITF